METRHARDTAQSVNVPHRVLICARVADLAGLPRWIYIPVRDGGLVRRGASSSRSAAKVTGHTSGSSSPASRRRPRSCSASKPNRRPARHCVSLLCSDGAWFCLASIPGGAACQRSACFPGYCRRWWRNRSGCMLSSGSGGSGVPQRAGIQSRFTNDGSVAERRPSCRCRSCHRAISVRPPPPRRPEPDHEVVAATLGPGRQRLGRVSFRYWRRV